jgi:16S rRNA (cytidine1402-2'-O)-methyltransferase
MLSIVSTPIGNLGDITLRAIDTLKSADLVLVEDTRRTGLLLHNLGIKKQMLSYNDHNKEQRIPYVLGLLKEGKAISLVTDSGTPCISDPGFELVRAALEEGVQAVPVPGACAAITALSASGLPTDAFSFHGFLPKKRKQKKELLVSLVVRKETLVFYESPYRLKDTLKALQMIIPGRRICIARELTKRFEEFLRGTPSGLLALLEKKEAKGEIVLLIAKGDADG